MYLYRCINRSNKPGYSAGVRIRRQHHANRCHFLDLDADVEIPAAAGVFADAASAELVVRQAVAVPEGQPDALESHLAGPVGERAGLDGNPAETAARTAGATPALLVAI